MLSSFKNVFNISVRNGLREDFTVPRRGDNEAKIARMLQGKFIPIADAENSFGGIATEKKCWVRDGGHDRLQ
jgi:hypothetical protein